jgi:hypothetical protein
MDKEELIHWINDNTACYAEDSTGNFILLDGVLHYDELQEIAKQWEEVKESD